MPERIRCGDRVKITGNRNKVKRIQSGLTSSLSQALGKIGRVVKIDEDGDVWLQLEDALCAISPACCTLHWRKNDNPVDSEDESGSSDDDATTAQLSDVTIAEAFEATQHPFEIATEEEEEHYDYLVSVKPQAPMSPCLQLHLPVCSATHRLR